MPGASRFIAIIAMLALAACGLPRGAGFKSEVLAAKSTADAADQGFSVYQVNRNTLPILQGWAANVAEPAQDWPTAQAQPASLRIAAGDILQLTIWDAEENSIFGAAGVTPLQPATVNTAGQIFVPYIGNLRVAGMAPSTARTRIEEELIRTVPSAQVQLTVEPGPANTANLAAGFAASGLYPLQERNIKILDLFSQAGGAREDLTDPLVRLVRDGRSYEIALDLLLLDPRANIAVQGGDRISVVEETRKFIALGATGTQSIVPFPESDLTALEALGFIGGVNAGSANPEAVLILRNYPTAAVGDGVSGPPQERMIFAIDLTSADGLFSAGQFAIAGDDLIYGTESALGPALTLFGLGNNLAALAAAN